MNNPFFNRRQLLAHSGAGAGILGLSSLLGSEGLLSAAETPALDPLAPRQPHFPAKAKAVIWLFINGGPSHVDTWDYKPELEKSDGKELEGFDKFTGFFSGAVGPLMKSPFKFAQHGESGKWVSDIFPQLSQHVDKMAFIHSAYAKSNNHSPGAVHGQYRFYADGLSLCRFVGHVWTRQRESRSARLCGDVGSQGTRSSQRLLAELGRRFLTQRLSRHVAETEGRSDRQLEPPAELNESRQRAQLDLLARLNKEHYEANPAEKELAARIESFELAYRMQSAAPEALDVDGESQHIQSLYGLDDDRCAHFARQCLTARRLVERGVRFIQIYSGGMENQRSWDGHNDIQGNHSQFAGETDKPIAALLGDLAQRGLLDSTLVIWGGEFGRLPIAQKAAKPGRDHNPHAMVYWLAGGGAKAGTSFGATDELGHKAADNRVNLHDLHATILHLMGMDHKQLTYRHNGRDFRLTDVEGEVIGDIVA